MVRTGTCVKIQRQRQSQLIKNENKNKITIIYDICIVFVSIGKPR